MTSASWDAGCGEGSQGELWEDTRARTPKCRSWPTEKSGEGTADGDNKTGRGLGRQRVPSMECEDVCEIVEKGVATGGAGGEPTDPKVWGLGPATCASTCAPGDADACWSVRSSELEHLETGLPRGLSFWGFFLVSWLTSPGHSTHIITRLAQGSGGGGRLDSKSASVLKTMIPRTEALLQRDILSEHGSRGLLDRPKGAGEWAQMVS